MEFLEDLKSLSVGAPTVWTRVSDFIPHIVAFIEKLLERDMAYVTDDGSVYFNLSAYSRKFTYGKLKPADVQLANGGQSESDFALWKAAKSASEPGWIPSWTTIKGRPGWHVCLQGKTNTFS